MSYLSTIADHVVRQKNTLLSWHLVLAVYVREIWSSHIYWIWKWDHFHIRSADLQRFASSLCDAISLLCIKHNTNWQLSKQANKQTNKNIKLCLVDSTSGRLWPVLSVKLQHSQSAWIHRVHKVQVDLFSRWVSLKHRGGSAASAPAAARLAHKQKHTHSQARARTHTFWYAHPHWDESDCSSLICRTAQAAHLELREDAAKKSAAACQRGKTILKAAAE